MKQVEKHTTKKPNRKNAGEYIFCLTFCFKEAETKE
jgi:hypothetical protein